jgi:hypothetical protein
MAGDRDRQAVRDDDEPGCFGIQRRHL